MPVRGGIERRNLSKKLEAALLPEQDTVALQQALRDSIANRPGVKASNVMYIPAAVVDGDLVTIGDDVFEVDIINTDSGVNTHASTGALNDTDEVSLLILTAAPATSFDPGDVLRIEDEMVLVLRSISTTQKVIARGYAGTAVASHVANTDVFASDANPASNISIPLVTTLTATAFGAAFAPVFNWTPPQNEDAPVRTATMNETLTAYTLGSKSQVLVVADEAGVNTTATTEDFSNSTDNVWANATLVGGVEPAVAGVEIAERAVTSAEELAGEMHFAFPFTVRSAVVKMFVTATGQQIDFDGQIKIGYAETTTEVLPSSIVTIRNEGPASTAYITPFASTHTIRVLAVE